MCLTTSHGISSVSTNHRGPAICVLVVILSLLGGLAGCRESNSTLTPSAALPEPKHQPDDIPWETQITAVQQDLSDRIEIRETEIHDDQLQSLKGLTKLRVLILDAGEITDEGTAILASLPNLSQLRLRDSPLTDQGLEQLAKSPSLQVINLPQGAFSADGLRALKSLASLRQLRIGSPKLDGKNTANALASLESLRAVHLIQVPLDDADLGVLSQLKGLTSLYIDGSKISDAGWGAFYAARPDVHVHVDQKHLDFDPTQD